MIATCPSSDRLHAFVLGHLQDQESDELYGHLAGCDSCQQQLEESGSFSDSFVGQLKSDTADEKKSAENHSAEPALLQATDRAKNILSLLNRPAGDAIADAATDDQAEPVPHTIGEYEIERLIGRGGMGTVYLARHTKLGRQVALKILSRHRLADPKTQGRFSSEMKAVGRMNHPNIVAAHDAREIDGVAVLVTEYIDGLNVGSIIRRTGPLSVANAARIASEVATALSAIDAAGLIHRDIKPSNIMVSRGGAVKLLDLGLARLQTADSEHHEHRDHTATGQALGTVDYISPEQVNDGRNVDVRADIYALGCTLFKMLTGQPVFDDAGYPTAFTKMTAHVQTPPPSVAGLAKNIPEPLAALVAEMLEKDPALRPQTPSTLIERLSPFTGDADLAALVEQASTTEEKPRASRPQTASIPTPVRATNSSRKFPRTPLLIATGLGGFLLGWAISWLMGIEITIKHPDGTTTKLNVANGSTVTIDENGNATVLLPDEASKTRAQPDATKSPNPVLTVSADLQRFNGIWSRETRDGDYANYVFVDGRFVQFFGVSSFTGSFGVDETTIPREIYFRPNGTLPRSGIYRFPQGDVLEIVAPYGDASVRPRDFNKLNEIEKLRRVDLTNVQTATDLPADVSPEAYRLYQSWNRNYAQNRPENSRSVPGFEAIWKAITPTELAGSYVVLANNHFALIGENADVTGTGSTAGWSGTFSVNNSVAPAQIDFIADQPGGQFRNKSIWQIDPNGDLLIAQAKIGLQQHPKSFESKDDSQYELFRLRKVEFPQTDNPNELANPYARSALRTFQQFQKGIFPNDPEFTSVPKPIPAITEHSFNGIWQLIQGGDQNKTLLILEAGQWAIFESKQVTNQDENTKKTGGTYNLEEWYQPDILTTKFKTPGQDFTLHHYRMDGDKHLNQVQYRPLPEQRITPTRTKDFRFSIEARYEPLDWSAITAPEQLPDKISRDAWQAWKELSGGAPAEPDQPSIPELTLETVEGIWQAYSHDSRPQGILVLKKDYYAAFLQADGVGNDASILEHFGNADISADTKTISLHGLKIFQFPGVSAAASFRRNQNGNLGRLQVQIPNPESFVEPPDQGIQGVQWSYLKRLDWSAITAPEQLPDQISRDAWQAWKELSAENDQPSNSEYTAGKSLGWADGKLGWTSSPATETDIETPIPDGALGIRMESPETVTVGQDFQLKIHVTNLLDEPLAALKAQIKLGSGIKSPLFGNPVVAVATKLGKNASSVCTVDLSGTTEGEHTIDVNITADGGHAANHRRIINVAAAATNERADPLAEESPPLITEESIQGVWKCRSNNGESEGFLIFGNRKYTAILAPITGDNAGLPTTREGTFRINLHQDRPPIILFSGEQNPIAIAFEDKFAINQAGELQHSSFVIPDWPKVKAAAGTNNSESPERFQISKIDWSAITAPEQLPDKISRDAWHTWKNLSGKQSTANDED